MDSAAVESVLQNANRVLALQFGNKHNMVGNSAMNTDPSSSKSFKEQLQTRSGQNFATPMPAAGLNRPVNAVASTLLQSPSSLAVRQQAMRAATTSGQSAPLKTDAAHASYRIPSPSRRAFNPAGSPAPGFHPNSSTPVKDSSAIRASSPGRIKAPAVQAAAAAAVSEMYLILPDADETMESHSDKMRSADSVKSRLLAGLGVLNISKCGLTSLQGLADVDGLEVLFASDNSLTNLAFTGTLSALREMHVQNNCIASLRGLSMLPRIQKISLFGNPISCHQYYRLMVVLCAGRSLQCIDDARVTLSEREAANHLGDNVARLVRCGYMLAETAPSNPLPPKVLRCADLMVHSSVVLAQSPVAFQKAESPKVHVTPSSNGAAKLRPFSAESRGAAGGPMRVWSVVPGSVVAQQHKQQLKAHQNQETSLASLLAVDPSNSEISKTIRPSSPVVVKPAKHDKDWDRRTKVNMPLVPPVRLDDDPNKPKVYAEPPKKQPLPVQARGRAASAERNQHSSSGDRLSTAHRQPPAISRPSSATRNRGNVVSATLDPKCNYPATDKLLKGTGVKIERRADAYEKAADMSFTQMSPYAPHNVENSALLNEWQWPGQSEEEASAASLAFSTLQLWWHKHMLGEALFAWISAKPRKIVNRDFHPAAAYAAASASVPVITAAAALVPAAQQLEAPIVHIVPSDAGLIQDSASAAVAASQMAATAISHPVSAAATVAVAPLAASATSFAPSASMSGPPALQKQDSVDSKVLLYAAELQHKGDLVVGTKLTLAAKKNKKNTAGVQLGLQFLWQRQQSENVWLDIAPRATAKASYLITRDDIGKILKATCFPSADDVAGPPVSATISVLDAAALGRDDSSCPPTPGTVTDTRVDILPVSGHPQGADAGSELMCTEPLLAKIPATSSNVSVVWHVGKSPSGPWYEAPNGRSRVWNPTVNDKNMYVRIVVTHPEAHVGGGMDVIECVRGPLSLPQQLGLEIDKRLSFDNSPFRFLMFSFSAFFIAVASNYMQVVKSRSRCIVSQSHAWCGHSEVSLLQILQRQLPRRDPDRF
jgi:hypothetical protein